MIEYNNDNIKPEPILSQQNHEDGHEDGLVPPPNVDDAALVRKIDMRVLPMLFIIYFVAFLDRYVNWTSVVHAFIHANPADFASE